MNEGLAIDAHIVTRVTNSAGQELYARPPFEGQRVLNEEIVHRMNSHDGRGGVARHRRGRADRPRCRRQDWHLLGLARRLVCRLQRRFYRRRLGRARQFHLHGPHHWRHACRRKSGPTPCASPIVASKPIPCPASSNPRTRRAKSRWRVSSTNWRTPLAKPRSANSPACLKFSTERWRPPRHSRRSGICACRWARRICLKARVSACTGASARLSSAPMAPANPP